MGYEDYYMMSSAVNSFNNSLANAANVVLAAQTSRQDRKFSRQMSDLAWQRNLEAWRMQNEYNLPANTYARQLEGLQANGLNPNLVYGNSGAVTGAAGGVSPYSFSGYHATAVPKFNGSYSPLNDMLNTKLLATQIEAQEANNRYINARADNESARTPGISAESNEKAYRWQVINNDLSSYDASVRAEVSYKYWKGQNEYYSAEQARSKNTLLNIEATTAEWLNSTEAPGTGMTYKQLMESYKSMMPEATYKKVKEETLNIISQYQYRAKQGELLDLKKIYQEAVNKFAVMGRTLGNDWATVLVNGIIDMLGGFEGMKSWVEEQFNKLKEWRPW